MDNETQKLTISVIMTALNEEQNIIPAITNTVRAFDDFNIKGEIVAIDDGSTDKTGDLINSIVAKDDRVRKLIHKTPQGIGASFWDGVDEAKGNVVVWFPGDNENDPWEILRYYRLLDHVDIVIPFIFNKENRSLLRNMLSSLYTFIINATFLVNFNYTNGTNLYRRSLLKELGQKRSKGFFFQTDIIIKLAKKGYLFAEVPCRLSKRAGGKSKAITLKSFLRLAKGYLYLIKEIYFTKEYRGSRVKFSEDSQTAKRRYV